MGNYDEIDIESIKLGLEFLRKDFDTNIELTNSYVNRAGIMVSSYLVVLPIILSNLKYEKIIDLFSPNRLCVSKDILTLILIVALLSFMYNTYSSLKNFFKVMQGSERFKINSNLIKDYYKQEEKFLALVLFDAYTECSTKNNNSLHETQCCFMNGIKNLMYSAISLILIIILNYFM